MSHSKINVAIVGGTGYTGVELLRLLAQHPNVSIKAITSRQDEGMAVAQMFPNLRGMIDLQFTNPEQTPLHTMDVVFFATPHGVAMSQAQRLVAQGVKIIDLAADFRLQDKTAFERWYKMPHACPDVLKHSVYGLPEINRDKIRQAQVVGNPGCYPTTVILGLLPLLEKGLIAPQGIIADCKSGVSGAGRKAAVANLFPEASDNFKAYGVSGHRHHPEITEQLSTIANEPVGLTFVPHLVPMIRGMFSTIYVQLRQVHSAQAIQQLFAQRYAQEAFVDVLAVGDVPQTRTVRASNYLRIAVQVPNPDNRTLIVMVAQDNLVKGASGQAIQNMNVMFDLPETTGLAHIAVLP
ncbi:N-acetyl-gamma-glutamyl-phosphate reductase [Brackiella oedipodis]|uniref:N-acetyl-gamma-glutamyl-phosphate reductase n=1 Tax=Brackiella oedipodis TaxID=124225 RepID=UPI00057015CC|nr:N-acetyl-gamma-glutamyl-phosphate reductase [Brackiella oedipodis]